MFNSDCPIQDNTPSDDIITLKVSKRPAKYYQYIKYEKEKLYDYKYLMSKIQSLLSANRKSHYYYVLYLKKRTGEELRVVGESDWNDYYFNSTIEEFIDARSILKVEFELVKAKPKETDVRMKTVEILGHYKSEVFLNKFIAFANRSEAMHVEFYEWLMKDIQQSNNANKSSIAGVSTGVSPLGKMKDGYGSNGNGYDNGNGKVKEIVKKKFNEIQGKIGILSKLESNVIEDEDNSNSSCNGCGSRNVIEEENNEEEEIQPFESYYNKDKLNAFRSKIINDTVSSNQSNVAKTVNVINMSHIINNTHNT